MKDEDGHHYTFAMPEPPWQKKRRFRERVAYIMKRIRQKVRKLRGYRRY